MEGVIIPSRYRHLKTYLKIRKNDLDLVVDRLSQPEVLPMSRCISNAKNVRSIKVYNSVYLRKLKNVVPYNFQDNWVVSSSMMVVKLTIIFG